MLHSLWLWLLDPAHAQATQAAASCLGVVVGLTTIGVLIVTVRAANRQAVAAQAEAEASRRLTDVSIAQQKATERAADAAEQQATYMKAATSLAEAQLKAAEHNAYEAQERYLHERLERLSRTQPTVQFLKTINDMYSSFVFVNLGRGDAYNIHWGYGKQPGQNQPISNRILPSGDKMPCSMGWATLEAHGAAFIEFNAMDGRKFMTIATKRDNELEQETTEVPRD